MFTNSLKCTLVAQVRPMQGCSRGSSNPVVSSNKTTASPRSTHPHDAVSHTAYTPGLTHCLLTYRSDVPQRTLRALWPAARVIRYDEVYWCSSCGDLRSDVASTESKELVFGWHKSKASNFKPNIEDGILRLKQAIHLTVSWDIT